MGGYITWFDIARLSRLFFPGCVSSNYTVDSQGMLLYTGELWCIVSETLADVGTKGA